MQMFTVVAAGILGILIGFWSGRSMQWRIAETEGNAEETGDERKVTESRQLTMTGTVIGSPVNGEIRKNTEETTAEGDISGNGQIAILPADGRVYAPTAGKVLKLYPMGNRIRFRTDSGVELLLEICRDREEVHSGCYHCNVLENEVVRKGKLLVEFDKDRLTGEGVDTAVTVEMCASGGNRQIVKTWKNDIRAGEELMWVQRRGRDQEDSFCLR